MRAFKQKQITLKDIAIQLGVSKSTVAKVLGNQPDSRVSETVAARVRKTAKDMGYQPNYVAQALRTGRTNLIGLIIPNLGIATYPSFLHGMYMGVLEMANHSDYSVVQLLTQPRKKLDNIIRRGLLDGIMIITSNPDNSDIDFLAETELPLVVINREVTHRNISFVTHEYMQAAERAVLELIAVGHRRLALLAMGNKNDSNQRMIKGFQIQMKALASQGVSGVWFDTPNNNLDGYTDVACQVIDKGPFDAYIVDMIPQAEILGRMLQEKTGHIIGQNKDLIVFSPEENQIVKNEIIPWQLYQHQNENMGSEAYNILCNQMQKVAKKAQQCYLPFKTVIREK